MNTSFPLPRMWETKISNVDTFFAYCRYLFSLRNRAHHFDKTTSREIQFIFTQRRVKSAARNPSHLLTIFPIKPCVIFWTGSPSSVPYTVKLEPGIFVIRRDFVTGQSMSKFTLVTWVYRKIWTVVSRNLEMSPVLSLSCALLVKCCKCCAVVACATIDPVL